MLNLIQKSYIKLVIKHKHKFQYLFVFLIYLKN